MAINQWKPTHTKAFGLWKASITGTSRVELPTDFAIVVVEGGAGTLRWGTGSRKVVRGDYFLKPAALSDLEYDAPDSLELLVCLPPAANP